MIDTDAVSNYLNTLQKIKEQGGKMAIEGGVLEGDSYQSGCYVKPCIAEVENHYAIVQHETFAPILYLIKYQTLEQAISLQNAVPQGLSSAIMTTDMRQAERFFILQQIDTLWREHLQAMDALRESVGLRSYGQKDPLIEYKNEGYDMFLEMMTQMRRNVIYSMFMFQPAPATQGATA
jgi:preprotein translocase subunit SecA